MATSAPPRIVAIGECMIEIADRPDGCRIGFGGDTLNTALYLSRLGMRVDYATVLGDDPYSDRMVEAWAAEGMGTALVRREPGRLPGLYAIRTDPAGERKFHYWRDRAPARELLVPPHDERLGEALVDADMIYLSGISVSILDEPQREKLLRLLATARKAGTAVAFDPNYRPAGWPGADAAGAWFERFYRVSTHVLPTLDDERMLDPAADASTLAERVRALGTSEVVVKHGPNGCLVVTAEGSVHVDIPEPVTCVDTTAAGDSFNAAYLAARLSGLDPQGAAHAAHRLAAAVIRHPGAIVPRDAMPALPGVS